MKTTKLNKKTLSYSVLCILVLISGFMIGTYAVTPVSVSPSNIVLKDGAGNVLLNGTFTGFFSGNITNGTAGGGLTGSSFIISINGSDYQRNNGTSGAIIEQSTNASAVIENALGNLTGGGDIFFKHGVYPVTVNHTITVNNLTLSGEGSSSCIQLNANTTNVFNFTASNITIQNLAFDGNYAVASSQDVSGHNSGNCIVAATGSNLLISKCNFYGWINHPVVSPVGKSYSRINVEQCMFKNNSWWDVAFAGGNFNIMTGCIVDAGYGLETSSSYNIMSNNIVLNAKAKAFILNGVMNQVINNYIYNPVTYGVSCEASNQTVIGNVIDYFTKDYGYAVVVISSNDNYIANNKVSNIVGTDAKAIGIVTGDRNVVINNMIRKAPIGLYVHDAASDNNVFIANSVNEVTTKITNNGTGTIFSQNIFNNLPSENSGSSVNATATTFSITHGLASTPTFVSYTFNSTDIDSATWTATTSTITVTVVGMTGANYTCYWHAIYKP